MKFKDRLEAYTTKILSLDLTEIVLALALTIFGLIILTFLYYKLSFMIAHPSCFIVECRQVIQP